MTARVAAAVLPPQVAPPVELLLALLGAGLPVSLSSGALTWDASRRSFRLERGSFDKDDQRWVSDLADLSTEAATRLLASAPVADLRSSISVGYNAFALHAWLRGDAACLGYADAARAWQDDQPTVAWRFAQIFQALAHLGAGQSAEAVAALVDVDDLTLWHAIATLYGYRSDLAHMRALWAVCDAFAKVGRPFAGREQASAAHLRAAGLPVEDWRPAGFPGLLAG